MLSYRSIGSVAAAIASHVVRCATAPSAYALAATVQPNKLNPRNAAGADSTMDVESAKRLLVNGWSGDNETFIDVTAGAVTTVTVSADDIRAAALDNPAALDKWSNYSGHGIKVRVIDGATLVSGHRRDNATRAMTADERKAAFGTDNLALIVYPVAQRVEFADRAAEFTALMRDNRRAEGQKLLKGSEKLRAIILGRRLGMSNDTLRVCCGYQPNNHNAPLGVCDLLGSKRNYVDDLANGLITANDLRAIWNNEGGKDGDMDKVFAAYDEKRKAHAETGSIRIAPDGAIGKADMTKHLGALKGIVGYPLFDDCLSAITSGKAKDIKSALRAAEKLRDILLSHGITKVDDNATPDRPAEKVNSAVSAAPAANKSALPIKRAAGSHKSK